MNRNKFYQEDGKQYALLSTNICSDATFSHGVSQGHRSVTTYTQQKITPTSNSNIVNKGNNPHQRVTNNNHQSHISA